MSEPNTTLALTPHGHLILVAAGDTTPLPEPVATRLMDALRRGSGHGLLSLGLREVGSALPPVVAWWRDFAARFVTSLCTLP